MMVGVFTTNALAHAKIALEYRSVVLDYGAELHNVGGHVDGRVKLRALHT